MISSGSAQTCTNGASTSIAARNESTANTWLPMCACSPTRSTAGDAAARSTARSASPAARPKPNFESSCPVFTYSWVCASMPGVMRSRTDGTSPSSACRRIEPVELVERVDDGAPDARHAGHAQLVGALVVAVEHEALGRKRGRGSATCSSPPVATSRRSPSSSTSRSHRAAQERLRTRRSRRPARTPATASRQRARRCSSS